jgi:hypothetical protein
MSVYVMGVQLTSVYLMGVHLRSVHLMGVPLIGIYLTGLHLMNAHRIGIYPIGTYPKKRGCHWYMFQDGTSSRRASHCGRPMGWCLMGMYLMGVDLSGRNCYPDTSPQPLPPTHHCVGWRMVVAVVSFGAKWQFGTWALFRVVSSHLPRKPFLGPACSAFRASCHEDGTDAVLSSPFLFTLRECL